MHAEQIHLHFKKQTVETYQKIRRKIRRRNVSLVTQIMGQKTEVNIGLVSCKTEGCGGTSYV